MGRRRGRRWALPAVAVLLVGALGVAGWTDLGAHRRTRLEQSALAAAGVRLTKLGGDLTTERAARDRAVHQRAALEDSIASTRAQTTTVQSALNGSLGSKFVEGLGIGIIRSCLRGVGAALVHVADGAADQATRDISGVSGPCLALDGAGPVYPFDFPDPFVVQVGATFFGYATNSAGGNIQIIESSDLVHWRGVGNALPSLPAWAAPNATWAPAVLRVGAGFVLYYSAAVAGKGAGEPCISVAVARQPGGPFVDASPAPLECQADLGGSIDPSPFVGRDGTPYLLWKSNGGSGHAPTLWSARLDPAGTGFAAGVPVPLLSADQPWESGVVEAPDLVLAGGRYFLFYSANDWNSARYAIGAATCVGPLGPCTKPLGQPFLATGPDAAGPGGASVFTDAAGAAWMAFAAWLPGSVGYPHSRALFVRRVDLMGPLPTLGPRP
jgi:hypothetical protein